MVNPKICGFFFYWIFSVKNEDLSIQQALEKTIKSHLYKLKGQNFGKGSH